jgi:hypothetical protein
MEEMTVDRRLFPVSTARRKKHCANAELVKSFTYLPRNGESSGSDLQMRKVAANMLNK